MGNRKGAVVAGLLALALLTAPGCVSKKMFRGSLDDTDARVVAVESAIEANERRISDLKKETDQKIATMKTDVDNASQLGNQALTKAKSAESAAKGKLLWTVTLTDDRVKFDFGKAVLDSQAISALETLANKVKSYGKALYLEVEGHTDNIGSENLNAVLGEKRAMAVRNFLNEQGGIPLHAMNTISYGESRPVADNASSGGRAPEPARRDPGPRVVKPASFGSRQPGFAWIDRAGPSPHAFHPSRAAAARDSSREGRGAG